MVIEKEEDEQMNLKIGNCLYIEENEDIYRYIKSLEAENKKYKEVIDKAIKYIDDNSWYYNDEDSGAMFCLEEEKAETFCNDLLDILKEV